MPDVTKLWLFKIWVLTKNIRYGAPKKRTSQLFLPISKLCQSPWIQCCYVLGAAPIRPLSSIGDVPDMGDTGAYHFSAPKKYACCQI